MWILRGDGECDGAAQQRRGQLTRPRRRVVKLDEEEEGEEEGESSLMITRQRAAKQAGKTGWKGGSSGF